MTDNEVNNVYNGIVNSFVEKKNLLLCVEVNSTEEAEELLRWMYAKEKPMKSRLVEVAWDKAIVPQRAAEAIKDLLEAFK